MQSWDQNMYDLYSSVFHTDKQKTVGRNGRRSRHTLKERKVKQRPSPIKYKMLS